MIKNYNSFLNEANVKNKIKRSDLKIGDDVITHGEFDGVNIDYQIGKILKMGDYGNLLIEFESPFSKKFHAGYSVVGKPGHCFYVPFENIITNNREKFERIIKKIREERKNRAKRLNAEYKEGDVIVGIGDLKTIRPNVNIDGEVGVIYYLIGNGGINPEDQREKNNVLYWVGFLDKFNKNMSQDYDGTPKNKAGLIVDKIHLRHATEKDKEIVKNKLDKIKKKIDEIKKTYEVGTIVIANGRYKEINFANDIGIVVQAINNLGKKSYTVRFLTRFNEYFHDIDGIVGDNTGFNLNAGFLREATLEEIEKSKTKIKAVQDDLKEFNHDYKIGDYIIAHCNYNGIDLDGQIGVIKKIDGQKPHDNFNISFFTDFINKFRKDNKVYRKHISPIKGEENLEIKRKLESGEILPFKVSNKMKMLLSRINIRIKTPFMLMSYFDITDQNASVSYLPVDKFKRLENGDDPYKSRLRQIMKIGKFFRLLDKDLTDKDVETFVNGYKATFDICITGIFDKLRLVSGEDVRYYYNEAQYVTGGGDLNGSCMRFDEKGHEMQMFVDNPNVIQLLILTNEKDKLLGRALVWRLVEPAGGTFMDYIYTRFDKDREIFNLYAEQRGWISAENRDDDLNIVCALESEKYYEMGDNALDHFDTFYNIKNDNTLRHGNTTWKRPPPEPLEPNPSI